MLPDYTLCCLGRRNSNSIKTCSTFERVNNSNGAYACVLYCAFTLFGGRASSKHAVFPAGLLYEFILFKNFLIWRSKVSFFFKLSVYCNICFVIYIINLFQQLNYSNHSLQLIFKLIFLKLICLLFHATVDFPYLMNNLFTEKKRTTIGLLGNFE